MNVFDYTYAEVDDEMFVDDYTRKLFKDSMLIMCSIIAILKCFIEMLIVKNEIRFNYF